MEEVGSISEPLLSRSPASLHLLSGHWTQRVNPAGLRSTTHTLRGITFPAREYSLGKAYEVLMVGVHVSQLNIDEEHDLQGYTR